MNYKEVLSAMENGAVLHVHSKIKAYLVKKKGEDLYEWIEPRTTAAVLKREGINTNSAVCDIPQIYYFKPRHAPRVRTARLGRKSPG
jgi:hypothetical protein